MDNYLLAAGTLVLGLLGLVAFFMSQPTAAKKRSEGSGMKPRGAHRPSVDGKSVLLRCLVRCSQMTGTRSERTSFTALLCG